MSTLMRGGWVLLLTVVAVSACPLAQCKAQFAGGGFADAFSNNERSGMATANLSQQGEWAEVVTVTAKWMVLMNQQGQQFPVAINNIGLFVIRWPTTLDKVAQG